jgi:type IV secretory pathway VirB10-like protein
MDQLLNSIQLFNKKPSNQSLKKVKVPHLKKALNLNLHLKKAQDQEKVKVQKKAAAANLPKKEAVNQRKHLRNLHLDLQEDLASLEIILLLKLILLKLLRGNSGKNQESLKKTQLPLEST